jgi:hypothetical protein
MSENTFYQVFMFAVEEDAEIFRAQFGGELMHPSQKGKARSGRSGKKIPENLDGEQVSIK